MAAATHETDVVAGGYLLVHRGDVPDVDGYLSASECIACQFPGGWALPWVDVDVGERRALLSHWGVDPEALQKVMAATDAAFDAGTIAWPAVFRTPRVARRFARAHDVSHPTLALIGIGLPQEHVDAFLAAATDDDDGFVDVIARGAPLADGPEAGWEVLGDDGGAFHSHHCHPDLAAEAADRAGIVPNGQGLLASRPDAEALARVYDSDAGTEAVRWLPWLLRTYPL